MTPADLERLIHRDPAARGLLAGLAAGERCEGQLEVAARSLVTGRRAGVVTGFFVPDADPPAAETDGLCGSILLADVLCTLQIETSLVTDEHCATALTRAVTAAGCRRLTVLACPSDPQQADEWRRNFWKGPGSQLTHLLAIERAGPACTREVLTARGYAADTQLDEFLKDLAPSGAGQCHNMRGIDIHNWNADLHRLFDERGSGICTIGIGDGGNEIGMGSLPWPRLVSAIPRAHAAKIACSTCTDFTILAGVSDWGAMALAVAVCLERNDLSPLMEWTADRIERTLQIAVREGPAIDGITRQSEPTVDGLPFITYIQPWLHIREQLGGDAH